MKLRRTTTRLEGSCMRFRVRVAGRSSPIPGLAAETTELAAFSSALALSLESVDSAAESESSAGWRKTEG